jgi:MFS family permease
MGLLGAGLFTGVTYIKIDSDDAVLWIALCARFLHGIWTGGHSSLTQAYISDVIPEAYKLKALSDIGLLNIVGQAIGPFIGFALALNEKKLGYKVYTTTGAALTVSILLMLLGLIIFFREAKEQKRNRRDIIPQSQEEFQTNFGVVILIFIWCSHFLAFSAIETITSPLLTPDSKDRNLDEEVFSI